MKKIKLRKWVKVVLIIMVLTGAVTILQKLDEDFMNGCTKAGYSEIQCKEAK